MMIELSGVHVTIQRAPILRGVNLSVDEGSSVALVGRNGAGKTTTLRTVMGLNALGEGAIRFKGESIGALQPHRRAHLGIGYMPEDRRLVPQLTVEENILLPAWVNDSLDRRAGLEFIYGLMPELEQMKERKALLLSGGQQKMVALGRALMGGTELLLLDEPFEGVAPALALRLSEVIGSLRAQNRSILIAQSELAHSSTLLDREVVIERGSIVD